MNQPQLKQINKMKERLKYDLIGAILSAIIGGIIGYLFL